MSGYTWRTIDFRPAALPGWRVLYLHDSGQRVTDVAGWLVQEEIEEGTPFDPPAPTGDRRVVAAIDVDGEVEPAFTLHTYWCVLGPSDSEPTADEEAQERTRQERMRALKAKAREERAS